jgi:hypothetical protein
MAIPQDVYERRRADRRKPNAPISWLPRAVPLLPNGHGPVVIGVAQDAVMGKWLLRQLEDRAKKEARCNYSAAAE